MCCSLSLSLSLFLFANTAQIGDISEIFPGDELCISCGEPWRPTEEDEDDDEDEEDNKKEEVKDNNKKGKLSESLVKELSAILPQFSNERLRETLEKYNGVSIYAFNFV